MFVASQSTEESVKGSTTVFEVNIPQRQGWGLQLFFTVCEGFASKLGWARPDVIADPTSGNARLCLKGHKRHCSRLHGSV